jgi:hypothetical protein
MNEKWISRVFYTPIQPIILSYRDYTKPDHRSVNSWLKEILRRRQKLQNVLALRAACSYTTIVLLLSEPSDGYPSSKTLVRFNSIVYLESIEIRICTTKRLLHAAPLVILRSCEEVSDGTYLAVFSVATGVI